MTRKPAGPLVLRLLGVLLVAAGFLAWIGLFWTVPADLDEVTAHSDEGGALVARVLVGAVLLILGMVLLHVAQAAAERRGRDRTR